MFLCIDLKCFYASVECVERGYDPFKVALVVANEKRGKGALCLAISPYLKKLGVRNRCRLFEIPNHIKYEIAMPRMKKYIDYSTMIYKIYLKFISDEDIYVYSIDEAFLDITNYKKVFMNKNAKEIGKMIIDEIYKETGITATCGIGSNLFLAKVALDIISKHSKDNIGYLDEKLFKKYLWDHKPLTDFWRIANGIEKRLNKLGLYTLKDVALANEEILYKEFGINAENIINHSKGIEPVTITEVKNYISKSKSLSNSQVLLRDYNLKEAELALKEMVELLVLELIRQKLVTNHISVHISYSNKLNIASTGGSRKLTVTTDSYKILKSEIVLLFNEKALKNTPIRKIGLAFGNLQDEKFEQYDLFVDVDYVAKERKANKALIKIKDKYGKNAVLRGMNLEEAATTKKRNKLIGGHNSGEDEE